MSYETFFFAQQNGDYFETIDTHQPTTELIDIVRRTCAEGWEMQVGGFWCRCHPRGAELGTQGWKMHVSGTAQTAVALLERLLPIFADEKVPFKFAADLHMVRLSTSKNWNRTAAAKFITAYPKDIQQFTALLERCHQLTRDLDGAYILTDRPYKDSRVIFYRYGGFRSVFEPDPQGQPRYMITGPDGRFVEDRRAPLFCHPAWVTDPFAQDAKRLPPATSGPILLRGRYGVTGAVRYSTSGGIYEGIDTRTNEEIIVRERRPWIFGWPQLIQKEARILQKLEKTGLVPRFIDLFEENGHMFLVQERIRADTMWARTVNLFLSRGPRPPAELFSVIRNILGKVAAGIEQIHDCGVILRDISKTNVLITPGDECIKLIDFEASYETDRDDPPIDGGTVGYRSPQQAAVLKPEPADDYFSFGALLIDFITVIAAGLPLNFHGTIAVFRQTLADLGLPSALADCAEALLDPERSRRPRPTEVARRLERLPVTGAFEARDPIAMPDLRICPRRDAPAPALVERVRVARDGIADYILANTEYHRDDRLWPASPGIFTSNPVSIRYGASGIAYFLWNTNRHVPERIIDWIVAHYDSGVRSPSLYHGRAGVPLLLLELGLTDSAETMFGQLPADPGLIARAPGLYDGLAGWGVANLIFWHATRKQQYLDCAVEAAHQLIGGANIEDNGICWPGATEVPLGLGSGASGIALFLLYLYQVCRESRLLEAAERALRYDMGKVIWVDGWALASRVHKRGVVPKSMSPHMLYGSAGTATVALRLHAITGEPDLKRFVEKVCYTVSSRYTNKLWQDWGLAGFGELLVDAYAFLRDPNYLHTAFYIAEGLLLHAMAKREGIAFAGEGLVKISCDFGLGSAGIGMFFDRLLRPDRPRLLFPDHLMFQQTERNREPAFLHQVAELVTADGGRC